MSDRAYIYATGLVVAVAVTLLVAGIVPQVPDDGTARDTAAGRVVQVLAFTFGMLGAISASAQVRRMYATRSAEDVSLGFLLMLGGSFCTWLAYGVVLRDGVMLVVNTAGITVVGTTWAYALRLRRGAAAARQRDAAAGQPAPDALDQEARP